jgi:hypothetical protein
MYGVMRDADKTPTFACKDRRTPWTIPVRKIDLYAVIWIWDFPTTKQEVLPHLNVNFGERILHYTDDDYNMRVGEPSWHSKFLPQL